MRSRPHLPWALATLLAALPLAAAEPADDVAPRREVDPNFLEYKPGKLASNVFEQSDRLEVSADQAVTFPVDF